MLITRSKNLTLTGPDFDPAENFSHREISHIKIGINKTETPII